MCKHQQRQSISSTSNVHHHYYASPQTLRHYHPNQVPPLQSQQTQPPPPPPPPATPLPQSPTHTQSISELADEDQAKNRLHQKRSVRGERRYHTADSIENMKKDKDSSIHKRLSWNYGSQSSQQNQGQQQQQQSFRGHERLLGNKHFAKCLSSESVYTSSGFSSTGSVPLSVNSCECEQCGIEVLSHIQEIESNAESPTSNELLKEPNSSSHHPQSSSSLDEDVFDSSDIKIDVSEVKDGISSVQITVSGSNLGKPSKSDLKKMKEFLLTSLDAS